MKVIPAIDLIDGKCVRLTQGDYTTKKVYSEDPVAAARRFEQEGAKYLHLVDLDGARTGAIVNWKVAERITAQTQLEVDFGGGIKKSDEIRTLLSLGIRQVNVGSIAIKQPELVVSWIEEFGAEKIILSADVKGENVQIHGWQNNTSAKVMDLIAGYLGKGITFVACTDIDNDGMMGGPNVALYKKIATAFPAIRLIASGGVSGLGDLAALNKLGVYGAIVGKAIYETNIPLNQWFSYGSE